MSWSDIEDAVQTAVVAASGLPPSSVIWSYQNQGEFPMPYVRLCFGGETAIGVDRLQSSTDLSRPNGMEVMQSVKGVREVPLDIEAYTSETFGDDSARRLCEVIRTKLRLDSIRVGLRAVGLVPFDLGTVQFVPDIPKAKFRGRAIVTLRCYVPVIDCYEYVGYIARVNGLFTPSGYALPSGATGIPFSAAVST